MESLHWQQRPTLRRPVLVTAFEGWGDAGDGASSAAAYLARRWGAEDFASIDPEEFFDFTSTRPEVRIEDGLTRVIDWPETTFSAGPLGGSGRDVIFLRGSEPQLRWRTFCSLVVDVVRSTSVEMVVSLGALLADVPHTRPVRVIGTGSDRMLIKKFGLRPSRYEGPTGINGVLHEAIARAGIPMCSLWASVPAYVGQTPSPKATLALVARLAELLDVSVPTVDLDVASAAYERQVNEVVAADDDAAAYVRSLEVGDDSDTEDEDLESMESLELAGGDVLAAEVERYLRDHGGG